MLARAWRIIVKRLRRMYPRSTIEYLAVVEATKKGEPHLHILYAGPFIAFRTLSSWMAELTQSPIVDIRKIRNPREVVRYVGKYITKKPEQFGTSKRYWSSQHYAPKFEPQPDLTIPQDVPWLLSRNNVSKIRAEFLDRGYTVYRTGDDMFFMYPGARAWSG